MKRYIYCLMLMVMFSMCINARQVGAYSVTVEKDGMYAEIVPPSIMKNVATMFKKQVQKAMKYYEKYKDADDYTFIKKVPDQYRDFIQVATNIQDSDEIVICHPFYIYYVPGEGVRYQYYFVAEKNHKKLCIFSIDVFEEDGKTTFSYDKMIDQYSPLYENITEETLFYQDGYVIYAETPGQVSVVRDTSVGGEKMEGDSTGTGSKEFYQMGYEEKKDAIFTDLDRIKKGKVVKKSDENIKLQLEDEYSEPDIAPNAEGDEYSGADIEGHGWGAYIAVCVGVLCILCILAAGVAIKRRKKG